MLNPNPAQQLLKSKLEIKRQMKYCQEQLEKHLASGRIKYEHESSWAAMIEAYQIALQILNGEEL